MANSTRFLIELPDEGADSDQWGNILNNAFSALEQRVTDRQNGDTIQSNLSVNGTFNVTGNTVLGDALTDTTTINGNASVTGNLSVNGNVTLGDAAGDTVTVPGSLSVNGNVTLGDALTDATTVSGNATVAGNFSVNGNTTIGNASTDTLTVHPSAVTYQNPVTHTNNHTFSGNVSVQGNTAIGDAGTDTATLNAQLSANGSVGSDGQVLTSRGANASPQWLDSAGGSNAQIFILSGTFTIPSGVKNLKVTLQGSGGNGGDVSGATTTAGGGGSGAYGVAFLTGLTPGQTISVNVTGQASQPASISSGTQTITTRTAGGGQGVALNSPIGGSGGTLTGPFSYAVPGKKGFNSGQGGAIAINGAGADSLLGYGGEGLNGTANGISGIGYGSGGGGAKSETAQAVSGGAGAPGIVIFEW